MAIFGRDEQKLQQVKMPLHESLFIAGDVCNLSDLDLFFQTTKNKLGKIDILVASAGIASRRAVDEVDEDYFDEMVDINFKGVNFTVQCAYPILIIMRLWY